MRRGDTCVLWCSRQVICGLVNTAVSTGWSTALPEPTLARRAGIHEYSIPTQSVETLGGVVRRGAHAVAGVRACEGDCAAHIKCIQIVIAVAQT